MPDHRTPADRADPQLEEQPPVLTARDEGSYAWRQLREAFPALIKRVRDELPYPPTIRRALDELDAELVAGVIQRGQPTADHRAAAVWWNDDHVGQSWSEIPFLNAESYFAAKLLNAVQYFDGPWQGLDPFTSLKTSALALDSAAAALDVLDHTAGLDQRERGHAFLTASVLGSAAARSQPAQHSTILPDGVSLVIDQSTRLWAHLSSTAPGRICFVADNAAAELISDLLLIDHFLTTGLATSIDLHLAPCPWRELQAMPTDLLACLKQLHDRPGHGAQLAQRLWTAMTAGRLEVVTHEYYCSPQPLHIQQMPPELIDSFSSARLTILKGDHNYRRLTQDRLWPLNTPFTMFTRSFPGPLLALRIIESPALVGVPGGTKLPSPTDTAAVIQVAL